MKSLKAGAWSATIILLATMLPLFPAPVLAEADPCAAVTDKMHESCEEILSMGAVGCADADNDGDSDAADCTTVVCNILGLCEPTLACGDVDGDGQETLSDCLALVCGFLTDCEPSPDCGDQDWDGDNDASDCYAQFCSGELKECLCPTNDGECAANICSLVDVNTPVRDDGGTGGGSRNPGCSSPCDGDLASCGRGPVCAILDGDGDEDCRPDIDSCGENADCGALALLCGTLDTNENGDCAPSTLNPCTVLTGGGDCPSGLSDVCLVLDTDHNGDCKPGNECLANGADVCLNQILVTTFGADPCNAWLVICLVYEAIMDAGVATGTGPEGVTQCGAKMQVCVTPLAVPSVVCGRNYGTKWCQGVGSPGGFGFEPSQSDAVRGDTFWTGKACGSPKNNVCTSPQASSGGCKWALTEEGCTSIEPIPVGRNECFFCRKARYYVEVSVEATAKVYVDQTVFDSASAPHRNSLYCIQSESDPDEASCS